MKNNKILLPVILATLVLGGCKPSTSDSKSEDVPTGDGQLLIDQGYTKATVWPNSIIGSYLTAMGVSETLPSFTTSREVYYAQYVDEQLFGQEIVEVAVLDATRTTLNAFHAVLEGANFVLDPESNLEEGFMFMSNTAETIAVYAEVFAAEEGWPAATHFFIAGVSEIDPGTSEDPGTSQDPGTSFPPIGSEVTEGALAGMFQHTGWPTAAINAYLNVYNITLAIPSLTVSGSTYTYVVTDDENFPDPYLFMIVPGSDRSTEYENLLTAAGYTVQADVEDPTYFYAYDPSYSVLVEYYYDVEYDGYPQGMYMYVSALLDGGNGDGGSEEPINTEGAITLSFATEATISGAKSTTVTTWAINNLSFKIEKGESTVNVGNFENPSKPEGYFFNSLRVYAAQVVTLTAPTGQLIQQVAFTTDDKHGTSVESLTNSAPAGVTVNANSNVVTFTVSSPKATFSFIAAAQFRLMELTVYFAA